MNHEPSIRIDRDELFTRPVDAALARERAMSGRRPQEPEEISPIRRLLLSSLFYLPLAGVLGALAAWSIIEPHFEDYTRIGGEVTLVNHDPFVSNDAIQLTVGTRDLTLMRVGTQLEPGVDGEVAYEDVLAIARGDHIETVGEPIDGAGVFAWAVRPASPERAKEAGQELTGDFEWAPMVLFPLTSSLIALFLFLIEGLSARNWARTLERGLPGTGLAFLFAGLAMVPAGLSMSIAEWAFAHAVVGDSAFVGMEAIEGWVYIVYSAGRSGAWCAVGVGLGLGMNLVRSTRAQLRNTVMGGALGGAVGGLFFDAIDRFVETGSVFEGGAVSRLVGLCAVGLAIGVFVALGERLAREAWVLVRTGPLAGKSFVLYRSPTVIGSAPSADIYLFKDAQIDPSHAAIHRVGAHYEIEDMGSRAGTIVASTPVTRRRLVSGEQIVLGDTILEFEERARQRASGAELSVERSEA